MAKKTDQTQDNIEETPTPEQVAEQEQAEKAEKAALKVQEDFDKQIDASDDVEETPLEDDDEQLEGDDKTEDDDVEETPSDEAGDDDAKGDDDGSAISDEIRKRATDLGMTPEEIAKFKDDAEAQGSIKILEGIGDDEEGEQQPTVPAAEKPEAKKVVDDKEAADPSVLVIENEDEIDPDIVKIMKAQHKKNYELEQRLAEQGADIQAEKGRLKTEREKVAMSRFDERIAGLGKDFHDTFGEGDTLGMSKRSTARSNRDKLGRHLVALGKAMVASGDTPTSDELFNMAVNNVFHKKVESVQGAELHAKTSKRSRQRLGRGATKKTGKMTPRQAAVKVQEEFDELIDGAENL